MEQLCTVFLWGWRRSERTVSGWSFISFPSQIIEDLCSTPWIMAHHLQILSPLLVSWASTWFQLFLFLLSQPGQRSRELAGGQGSIRKSALIQMGWLGWLWGDSVLLKIHSDGTSTIPLVAIRSKCGDHFYSNFPSKHLSLPYPLPHSRCSWPHSEQKDDMSESVSSAKIPPCVAHDVFLSTWLRSVREMWIRGSEKCEWGLPDKVGVL